MALIRCKECGREVSDLATYCPTCGAPIKKPRKSNRFTKMRTGFGLTNISLGILFLSMILQSESGISGNTRMMGTSWFLTVTGILCIIGRKSRGFTIVSIVFYSLSIIYNLVMTLVVPAHFFIVTIMTVFLILTSVSLTSKESFKQIH